MRLIDADALKEEVNKKNIVGRFNTLSLIDNAPTVEANSIIDGLNNQIDDLSDELAWYVNERNKLLEDHRPQGKWELIKDKVNNIHAECPFCKFQIKCIAYNYEIWEVKQFIKNSDFDFEFPNFCENCGAELKGIKE